MDKLVKLLISKGITICSCESLTGGLFASSITTVPGVSAVFKGSIVTYATEIKTNVANVKKETVEKYGVVSSQCAKEMAENCASILNCKMGISFTGNAGPDTMEGKPKGLVYSAICYNNKTVVFEDLLDGDRNSIRNRCVELMTDRIIELLEK